MKRKFFIWSILYYGVVDITRLTEFTRKFQLLAFDFFSLTKKLILAEFRQLYCN